MFHPVYFTAEIVIHSTNRGNERANVFHYGYNARPSELALADLLLSLSNSVLPALRAFTSTVTHFYRMTATDITDPNSTHSELGLDLFGADGNASAPGNVAVVLSKRTGAIGRAKRGRWYTYDLAENKLDEDTVTTALMNLLIALGVQLLRGWIEDGVSFTPVVASKKNGSYQALTSITIDTISDSMRRRLTGRGS